MIVFNSSTLILLAKAGILDEFLAAVKLYEEGIVSKDEAHLKLAPPVRYGRYKGGIVEDAISKLEVK